MCHQRVPEYACKHVRMEEVPCPSMVLRNPFPHIIPISYDEALYRISSKCAECSKKDLLEQECRETEQLLDGGATLSPQVSSAPLRTVATRPRTIPRKPLSGSAGQSAQAIEQQQLISNHLLSPAAQQQAECHFNHSIPGISRHRRAPSSANHLATIPDKTREVITETRTHPACLTPGRRLGTFVTLSVAQVPAYYGASRRAHASQTDNVEEGAEASVGNANESVGESAEEKREDSLKEVQDWGRGLQEIRALYILKASSSNTPTRSTDDEPAKLSATLDSQQGLASVSLPPLTREHDLAGDLLKPQSSAWSINSSSGSQYSVSSSDESEASSEPELSSRESPQLPLLQRLSPLTLEDTSLEEMLAELKNW